MSIGYEPLSNSDIYESEIDMALNTLNFSYEDYQVFYDNGNITEEEMEKVKDFFDEKEGR